MEDYKVMRHAILVAGMKDSGVLQQVINLYDDKDIDFFVHFDKKFAQPKLVSSFSHIQVLNPDNIYWGGPSLVALSLRLLKTAYTSRTYDYYHLISSEDFPMKSKSDFMDFFVENSNTEYVDIDDVSGFFDFRIRSYHFFEKWKMSRSIKYLLSEKIGRMQMKFGIDRADYINVIGKGSQWFSVSNQFVQEIFSPKHDRFLNLAVDKTLAADEVWIQTILLNSDNRFKTREAMRYVDWERGKPFKFSVEDFDEIKIKIKNKDNYLFIRKVDLALAKELVSILSE
ncbi:hypothetical protein HXX27_10935 [Weissella confusa]|uniref:beta-1,6-N-acetylglucosaminyltransferase n=1 Tax=Weissella confusa TaxID=1583 RepID=UPI0018A31160|nr:beta-1,6-N-acetylglucosaminyltransferase [Weissella confusa]MBF7057191.1 hypothetical protein [Weissella confusa]